MFDFQRILISRNLSAIKLNTQLHFYQPYLKFIRQNFQLFHFAIAFGISYNQVSEGVPQHSA